MSNVIEFPEASQELGHLQAAELRAADRFAMAKLPEKANEGDIEVLFGHTQALVTRVMADVRFPHWHMNVNRPARIIEVKDAHLGGEARSLTVTPADEKWGYHIKKVAHRPQEIRGRPDYVRDIVEFSLYPDGRATKVKRRTQEGDGPRQLDPDESERTMSKQDVEEVDAMLQEIIGLTRPRKWYRRIGHAAVSRWLAWRS